MNEITNNKVKLTGTVVSEPEFIYEVYGEQFFNLFLEVKRISGVADIVPLTISERLFNLEDKFTGTVVRVSGQFRSFNKHEENKNRLVLSVFVREIERVVNDYDEENEIEIDGFVCKDPVYRKTPLGREIADILFAVNRSYGKSDYIPCIVWGRNAVYTSGLPVGTHLKLTGRIQSRGYVKMYEDGTEEQRTAYEVSVSKINVLEEEN
ncbi:single-stranded DNA-binding protein [Roseburia hominis]|uniref:single-stranded DNA-binding protein n=1 Tax=Roseburia hominis TaxID=301301 RepID=UPI001C02B93C|nr:single-stranded DNA-binding protein [Roseburia hominis]MBT9667144.1 single-stranded DNA-binding protein [Roseburia hominis]